MRFGTTKIAFMNAERAHAMFNDQTEFDTCSETELAQLWWEFCKENDLIEISKSYEHTEGKCCLCGGKLDDPFGNNPWPFEGGRCCNACNATRVTPARIATIGMSTMQAEQYAAQLKH